MITAEVGYHGNYTSWEEALKNSTGFDNPAILKKVRESALLVKEGKAVFERDSVLFDKIQYTWPVIACLQHIAIASSNLCVLDFGGSLGTTYFQSRRFLQQVPLKWFVVEQPHYVDCGIKEFADDQLRFAYSIEEVITREKINCLLVSGTLQCLEKPVQWIESILHFDNILIDRTSFIEGEERLMIETVPEQIYRASFPCWFFNEDEFIKHFTTTHELITVFDSADESTVSSDFEKMYWKGFFFKKKILPA